jgi:hypothetical protein
LPEKATWYLSANLTGEQAPLSSGVLCLCLLLVA